MQASESTKRLMKHLWEYCDDSEVIQGLGHFQFVYMPQKMDTHSSAAAVPE